MTGREKCARKADRLLYIQIGNMHNQSTDKTRRAICGICSAGCWAEVTYDQDGKIASVKSDESSPYNMLCRSGQAAREIVYSPHRLLYPMRRNGPKGSFDFERISWDAAFDIIVENLQRIKAESGPEATAIYTGSGSFELALCDIFQPKGVSVSSASSVLFPFGSPNTLGVGALCYVSFAMIAPHVTMGRMFINTFSDIENAEMILIWGKNPASHAPLTDLLRIQEAHRRGAKIVVIDPRQTLLAKYPEAEWIPIRPGTDGALALGLCNILIDEELHDETFASQWTAGFEEFSSYVQHFRPEVVAQITGIPADTVIRLARRIAATRGVAPVMYSGLEYSDGAVQAIRATFVLWALAGQLDVPGGLCFTMQENHFPINRDGHLENPAPRKAAGHNDFPVYTAYRGEFHAGILPRAVLEKKPYPIRLLLSLGASIITSWPQSGLWEKTLAGLDFFACIDRQLTADAAYADIILPAATYYEIESYMVYGSTFRLRERIIEPVGEARNDFLILAELAERLGYGHLYPQTEDAILERALENTGFTVDEVRKAGGSVQVEPVMMQYKKWQKGGLRPDGKPGFDTPTGKLELASVWLAAAGHDALFGGGFRGVDGVLVQELLFLELAFGRCSDVDLCHAACQFGFALLKFFAVIIAGGLVDLDADLLNAAHDGFFVTLAADDRGVVFGGDDLVRLAEVLDRNVAKGDVLIILESMKMQNELKSPQDGKISRMRVKVGDNVERKQTLLSVV